MTIDSNSIDGWPIHPAYQNATHCYHCKNLAKIKDMKEVVVAGMNTTARVCKVCFTVLLSKMQPPT